MDEYAVWSIQVTLGRSLAKHRGASIPVPCVEVSAAAVKRVIAWQLMQAMKAQWLSKLAMARRMGTSRSHLDSILDARDPGMTLETLSKAARAVGCRVRIELPANAVD
jgi:antitoxin HicB